MKARKTNSWKAELLLPVIDGLALAAAFFFAFWLRIDSGLINYRPEPSIAYYLPIFFFSLAIFWIIFYANHLYDPHDIFYGTFEYVQIIKTTAFGILGVIIVSFFLHREVSRGWLLIFWFLATCFTGVARFLFRRLIRLLFRSGQRSDRALVLGASEEASAIAQTLTKTGRMEVVGFLDDFSPLGDEVRDGIVIKGVPQDYKRIAEEEDATHLILVPGAVSWETYHEILNEAMKCEGLNILIAPRLSGIFSLNLRVSYISYVPMLRIRFGHVGGLDKFAKNLLDRVLGSAIFILSLPVMLWVSLWVLYRLGWPIFESRRVLGRYGRPFRTYKFRTGVADTSHRHFISPSRTAAPQIPQRRLSLKQFLLASGLDKLPQLINVIYGQMSLVGPRTIYKKEARSYGIWLPSIMAVKPGMTGPWAISEVRDLAQEISLTLSYILGWTPWKDLQILFFTLFYLAQKRLIVRKDERAVMSFDGGIAKSAMLFTPTWGDRVESAKNLCRTKWGKINLQGPSTGQGNGLKIKRP